MWERFAGRKDMAWRDKERRKKLSVSEHLGKRCVLWQKWLLGKECEFSQVLRTVNLPQTTPPPRLSPLGFQNTISCFFPSSITSQSLVSLSPLRLSTTVSCPSSSLFLQFVYIYKVFILITGL